MKKLFSICIVSAGVLLAGTVFAADGAKIYGSKCSVCHGPKGAGTPMGPGFKGNEFITKGKAADIKKVIIEGRTGKDKKYPKLTMDMPKNPMPDDEADALIKFMQTEMQK